MLNRSLLLQQLQEFSDQLFIDISDEINQLRKCWQLLLEQPQLPHTIKAVKSEWHVPEWQGALDAVFPVGDIHDYRVFSIDGSQIYPDKHQGTNCFLVNIGIVDLSYGQQHTASQKVLFESYPHLFLDTENEQMFALSTELVNCRRQEYELRAILEHAKKINAAGGSPIISLFDGSLIFWHLDSKDIEMKQTFLSCYLFLLHQLYELKMPIAGYISLAKSKELVNIVRAAIHGELIKPENKEIGEHCVDATIASFFLTPGQRTTVFKNTTTISNQYPDHLRPYFFYLHVGNEIGRVEIPAWIARDEALVNQIAAVILDQSKKGRGYPVAIAEAHEQAVIKGPDREFFYHLIYKLGFERKQRFSLSQKSIKKRGIGI